jgi:hypothetical protein
MKDASSSFFEKKETKKLFSLGTHGRLLTGQPTATSRQWIKVFLVLFFQKKNCFLPLALLPETGLKRSSSTPT